MGAYSEKGSGNPVSTGGFCDFGTGDWGSVIIAVEEIVEVRVGAMADIGKISNIYGYA